MKIHGLAWLGCAAASSFGELSINATHIQQIVQDPTQVIQYWSNALREPIFTTEDSLPTKDIVNVWTYLMDEFHVSGLTFAVESGIDQHSWGGYTHVLPEADGMVTLNFTISDRQ